MSVYGVKLVSKATEREIGWIGFVNRYQRYRDSYLYTYASDCTATSDTLGISSTATFQMVTRTVTEINPVYYRCEEVWKLKGTWATPVP